MRRTKIICTLGPAVDDEKMIKKLILNGMDCARFNFSHGTHEEQRERMERVRKVSGELGIPIALLLDTKGPEIRLKDFEGGSAMLKSGQTFTLDTDKETPGDATRIGLTFDKLAKSVSAGTRILIDDGKIALKVEQIKGTKVICTVINGGKVSDHKSINIPNVSIPMPYLSQVDKDDILFGIEQQVDFIAASFVRSVDDVRKLRKFLKDNGGEAIQIISKIENGEGVKNLAEIIEESDGIMVARGDLGVEIPFKKIPALQKVMINQCNEAGKIVVTATQMLESMTQNPRPTRAEVSDVANAIYDGTT
ncbi:MAG: pyruvate kinase, partial [Lachnospiraceae bacterium]|nr:pyruvate kinase [Lachnospiraceae bacterium]